MAASCGDVCAYMSWFLLEYKTPKIVTIRSWKVGLFNRLVQISIIVYVILYVMWYKQGYQEVAIGQTAVTTKVKGIASTLHRKDLDPIYRRVWDTAEYVIPAQENSAFFVLTNAVITANQKLGKCPEDPGEPQFHCKPGKGNICEKGEPSTNGIMTGNCVNASSNVPENARNFTCEIEAWCPPEQSLLSRQITEQPPLLPEAQNFTVLIKNYIRFGFGSYEFRVRNILESIRNETYLKKCRYNEESDPFCPIFRIGDILDKTRTNFSSVGVDGCVIGIMIDWFCNMDTNNSRKNCKPKYSFSRLDYEEALIAKGWNFRFSKESHLENATFERIRDLYKAYGILFVVSVRSRAGKFSAVPLFTNIGSGLALLGIATILCDMLMLYLLKNRRYYSEKKYLKVIDDDVAGICSKLVDSQDEVLHSEEQEIASD